MAMWMAAFLSGHNRIVELCFPFFALLCVWARPPGSPQTFAPKEAFAFGHFCFFVFLGGDGVRSYLVGRKVPLSSLLATDEHLSHALGARPFALP